MVELVLPVLDHLVTPRLVTHQVCGTAGWVFANKWQEEVKIERAKPKCAGSLPRMLNAGTLKYIIFCM